MQAQTRGFDQVGMILLGLVLILLVAVPAAKADTYNPADWAPMVWSDSGFLAADLGAGKITFSASRAAGETVGSYTITPDATDGASSLSATTTSPTRPAS